MLDITVHVLAWNEQFLLPRFYDHYAIFTKYIIVHDNESTEPVPPHPKVTVIPYCSGDKQNNRAMAAIKNECWKNDTTEWSIVCDADEFLEIDVDLFLAHQDQIVFQCYGVEMMGVDGQALEDIDRATIPYGVSRGKFDKMVLFNNSIKGVNYRNGAHRARPDCPIVKGHRLRHYNQLGEEYTVQRWQRYIPRISDSDKRRGCGDYSVIPEEAIRTRYREYLERSEPIQPLRLIQKALSEKLATL